MTDKPLPLDKEQIPVLAAGDDPLPLRKDQIPLAPDPPRPADTTTEQDRTTAGQRRVNIIWEVTQSVIALSVVFSNLFVAVNVGLTHPDGVIPDMLSNSLFLVIGFYFSRTNHSAIGGVGRQPSMGPYVGR